MIVEFNDKLRGVDVFDRKRSQFSYSLEKFSTCHKWWQKGFMGFFDIANTAAFICWNFINPKQNTHAKWMKEIHQGYVNNTWDETGNMGFTRCCPCQAYQKYKG